METNTIVNKVAESGLITFNLEDYYLKGQRISFDLKDFLYEGLVLREKDFRDALKNHSWQNYEGKLVALHCSADAIVPTWAFMLASSYLQPLAKKIVLGDLNRLEEVLFSEAIHQIDVGPFVGGKVIVKGCSRVFVPSSAYVDIANKLRPHVHSLFFGEACSTVPLYKKPNSGKIE